MGLPEQISKEHGRHKGWQDLQKKHFHKTSRRMAKEALRKGEEPPSIDNRYSGYTG